MPDVKYEFVRGNSSGIDGTSLKDGQILFDKQKKTISLDATVNGTLTRINMSGDNTFNGTAAEWEALTDAQRAAYKYVYITDDYEVISKEMEGASATTNGVTGLVPQPIAGDQDKVLYGDGTWKEASTFSGDYDDLTNKPTLGTASELDVAESGDAAADEVVLGSDSRLSNARNAADVYAWAKAETKPTYTASEVGLGKVGNFKAVSTEENQGLTTTEQANARANIGAGTSSFDGDYDSLIGKPTLGTAAEKNVATSGDAGSTEVVMGNDSRLTNSRNAADVYSWAKAENKPSYTASEVGAYTKSEVDNKISTLETNIDWKEAVATYDDIATTYPNPVDGWTVNVKDTDYTYRYNGSAWVAISANAIPEATTSVNGLMTTTQVTKLNGIATGAEVNVQSDWNVTDDTSDAFIKNKPTIPDITTKMDKSNPTGTGTFSLNRLASSTVGSYSFAEGYNTTASGSYGAHAEGYGSIASGDYAPHAEGQGSTASGKTSHAEGFESTASGELSHAENYQTTASGKYSHSEGYKTEASSDGAHAEGWMTEASGAISHAEGYNTEAQYAYQHVGGKFNDNKTDTLFEIGKGTANNARTNAFEVYDDGSLSTDNGTTKVKLENLVLTTDARLSDARPASDVSAWAKASTKPSYTAAEVGLGNVGNFLAVSTVASQGLTDTQKSNARANIGAGTSNFSGSYNDLTNKPTIPTVNNATLTIQKNGTSVKTFTANASSDVTANITVPTKVSELTNDSGYTTNTGTITGITMNNVSKGTSGVVNLGTVITAHQDISGKADKSATVSTITWDSTNKKLTKTINGSTTDVVTGATILGGLTKSQVTTALGYTPPTSDTNTTYAAGTGVTITGTNNAINVTYGSIANTACQGNDSRLSDARTPTAHNQASNTITTMTGYSKPSSTSAISTSDSLNTAIGKLEKAIDGKGSGTVTGSGTSGYIAKFNGTSSITNGPAFGSSNTTFLRNDGTWNAPPITSVSLGDTGTASATAVNYQRVGVNGGYTTVRGTMYMEQSITLSTSADTTATFTNSNITTSSAIDVYTSVASLRYKTMAIASGSCTVTFDKQSSASTISVRIYIK